MAHFDVEVEFLRGNSTKAHFGKMLGELRFHPALVPIGSGSVVTDFGAAGQLAAAGH